MRYPLDIHLEMAIGEVWAGDTYIECQMGKNVTSTLHPLLSKGKFWFSFTQVLKAAYYTPPSCTPQRLSPGLRLRFSMIRKSQQVLCGSIISVHPKHWVFFTSCSQEEHLIKSSPGAYHVWIVIRFTSSVNYKQTFPLWFRKQRRKDNSRDIW